MLCVQENEDVFNSGEIYIITKSLLGFLLITKKYDTILSIYYETDMERDAWSWRDGVFKQHYVVLNDNL